MSLWHSAGRPICTCHQSVHSVPSLSVFFLSLFLFMSLYKTSFYITLNLLCDVSSVWVCALSFCKRKIDIFNSHKLIIVNSLCVTLVDRQEPPQLSCSVDANAIIDFDCSADRDVTVECTVNGEPVSECMYGNLLDTGHSLFMYILTFILCTQVD